MDQGFGAESPLGYQQLALDGGAQLTIPAGTTLILFSPEAQACRYRDDGPAPTAGQGMLVPVGTVVRYTGRSPGSLRFISAATGSILNVLYYGMG